MSCFVNQCKFLGCWLKRDFKLHDTVSHVNLNACYSTGKGHCNIMRVFKIHRIARKFHQKKKGTQKYTRKYTTCKILHADCYNLHAFGLLEFLPYRVCAG